MEEIENWLPIKGYEKHYEVSDLGRVRSIDRYVPFGNSTKFYSSVIKKSTKHHKNKYHSVLLKVEGDEKRISLSRLVAEHFIPNPENKPEVNHKFGNKDDNRAISLEWNTPVENTQHAIRTGLNKNNDPVLLVKETAIIDFPNKKEAARYAGVSDGWMGHAVKRGFEVNGFKAYAI